MADIREEKEGVEYFSQLPGMIQDQIIEHGVPINSKSAMESFYNDILHSGPTVVGMEEEEATKSK